MKLNRAFLIVAVVLFAQSSWGQHPVTPVGYKLVWADEFNQAGAPDPANWTFERGLVRNEEAQWYQPENARCEKGLLVIETRREPTKNPGYNPTGSRWQEKREVAEYTSSSLLTRGLHQWQYGRFEMRAKIDTRPGLWPAFWTLGVTGEWPSNGEIDIMEYYRGMLLFNAAWGTEKRYKAEWDSFRKPLAELNNPDWSQQFHIWRMDWDEVAIRLYLDDELLNTIDLTNTINRDGTGKNPFHQPHYLLVNVAVGGMNGGDPTGTQFPARMEVDYIRVFQKSN